MMFILDGKNDHELEERTRRLLSIIHNDLQCEAIVEDEIGSGLFLSALPLNYSPDIDQSAQRFIRILASDAKDFLPVFDSFRGFMKPTTLHLSRENNLVPFSLKDEETISCHTLFMGKTGGGKSGFAAEYLMKEKRNTPEPLFFIIDKKSSHKNSSRLLHGNMTIFETGQKMPFSPFRGIFDETKCKNLTNLFIAGMKMLSPGFETSSEHYTAIDKALKLGYEKRKLEGGLRYKDGEISQVGGADSTEINVENFIVQLASLPSHKGFEQYHEIVDELLRKLKPFYGDGIYSSYFNSFEQSRYSPECLYYLYDLDALDSDPILQTMMTMAVTEEIRQIIKRPEHAGREGFIVVEEIGMLGRENPVFNRFVKDVGETYRKLGFFLMSLTPRVKNYFETEAGKAMFDIADWFIFTPTNEDEVDFILANSSILDEATAQIVKSLKIVKGSHVEIFVTSRDKSKRGVLKYIQGSMEKWLSPSNPSDNIKFERILDECGGDAFSAFEKLAAENQV